MAVTNEMLLWKGCVSDKECGKFKYTSYNTRLIYEVMSSITLPNTFWNLTDLIPICIYPNSIEVVCARSNVSEITKLMNLVLDNLPEVNIVGGEKYIEEIGAIHFVDFVFPNELSIIAMDKLISSNFPMFIEPDGVMAVEYRKAYGSRAIEVPRRR